jgi:hypothetical protein
MKRFLVAIARLRCPMTLSTFVCQVNAFIEDEGVELPKVDVSWARRFLDRNNLCLYTGRPLETYREKWDSSVNSDVWYTILAEAMVAAGIAENNPHFDPSDPASELVINIDTTRMFSADETKMDTDVQSEHSLKVIGEVTSDKADTPIVLTVKAPGHYTGLACTGGDGSSAAMFAIFQGANVPRDLQGKEHLAPGSHHMDGAGLSLSFGFNIVMLIYLFLFRPTVFASSVCRFGSWRHNRASASPLGYRGLSSNAPSGPSWAASVCAELGRAQVAPAPGLFGLAHRAQRHSRLAVPA